MDYLAEMKTVKGTVAGTILFLTLMVYGCAKDELPLLWETLPTGLQADLLAMETDGTGTVWIAGGRSWTSGGVWHSEQHGADLREALRTEKALLALHLGSDGSLIASGVDGHVWNKTPGMGWAYRHFERWGTTRAIGMLSPDRALFAGGEGFDEGFAYWIEGSNGPYGDAAFLHRMNGVGIADSQSAVIVGYGIALMTSDAGNSWKTLELKGDHFMTVHFPTRDTGFIAGYEGSIHRSVDGGHTWQQLRDPGNGPRFRCIRFRDSRTGFAAGDDGAAWLTRDGGAQWARMGGLPSTTHFFCGSFSGEWLLLGGSHGSLLRTLVP